MSFRPADRVVSALGIQAHRRVKLGLKSSSADANAIGCSVVDDGPGALEFVSNYLLCDAANLIRRV